MSTDSTALPTDLWLERSRMQGMLLAAVSYGILFLLSLQTSSLLTQRWRRKQERALSMSSKVMLAYIWITFILATIGFAGNAQYTQMIWIDLRNSPGGPPALIFLELDYWVNRMALAAYYVMEWFMIALLLWRCYVIWEGNKFVMSAMALLFLGIIASSILVLVQFKSASFYNANSQISYLALSLGATLLYTVLIAARILMIRHRVSSAFGGSMSKDYISIVAMIVESSMMYAVLAIVFIVSFAIHSNVSNLIFLDISHVQGIAQLLIILRVARGRSFSWASTEHSSTLRFAPSRSEATHDTDRRTEDSSTLGHSKKRQMASTTSAGSLNQEAIQLGQV